MNQLQSIQINKIKLDKNQPRKFIDEEHVKELAVSIKNEGLINAIECDPDYTIITGELRYRASKLAGLKEVPVKIVEIQGMERFIRQMHENVHHNTMSVMDTAKALKKVSESFAVTPPPSSKKSHPTNYAIALSKLFGLSPTYVSSLLKLLEEPEEIQKLLENKKLAPSIFKEVRGAPEQYQLQLKKKAIQEGLPRDGVRHLAQRLKELDADENYKFANELLKKDYSKMDSTEMIAETKRISTGVSVGTTDKETVEKLEQLTNEVIKLLEQRPMSVLKGLNQTRVRISLTLFIGILVEYMEGEQKRLEIKELLKIK